MKGVAVFSEHLWNIGSTKDIQCELTSDCPTSMSPDEPAYTDFRDGEIPPIAF